MWIEIYVINKMPIIRCLFNKKITHILYKIEYKYINKLTLVLSRTKINDVILHLFAGFPHKWSSFVHLCQKWTFLHCITNYNQTNTINYCKVIIILSHLSDIGYLKYKTYLFIKYLIKKNSIWITYINCIFYFFKRTL